MAGAAAGIASGMRREYNGLVAVCREVNPSLMPIYEYECRPCRQRFEALVLSKSAPAKCPACGSPDLQQLISACAVSSESSRQANLSAAHRKVAAARNGRLRDEHRGLHEHFDDKVDKRA